MLGLTKFIIIPKQFNRRGNNERKPTAINPFHMVAVVKETKFTLLFGKELSQSCGKKHGN